MQLKCQQTLDEWQQNSAQLEELARILDLQELVIHLQKLSQSAKRGLLNNSALHDAHNKVITPLLTQKNWQTYEDVRSFIIRNIESYSIYEPMGRQVARDVTCLYQTMSSQTENIEKLKAGAKNTSEQVKNSSEEISFLKGEIEKQKKTLETEIKDKEVIKSESAATKVALEKAQLQLDWQGKLLKQFAQILNIPLPSNSSEQSSLAIDNSAEPRLNVAAVPAEKRSDLSLSGDAGKSDCEDGSSKAPSSPAAEGINSSGELL